jgi:membrane-associated protease RseP (regulator of RpoE activity)
MLKGLTIAAAALVLATGAVVAFASSDDNSGTGAGRSAAQEGEATPVPEGEAHGWLGVSVHPAEEGGVVIKRAFEDGPAAQAGLGSGDRITVLEGTQVDSVSALREAVASRAPGDEVTVTVVRAGTTDDATEDVNVTLGERPTFRDIRGEIGEKLGELFDRFLGGSFRYLDDEGNVIELETVPGTITAISDTEVTIDMNGDEGERTFSIGEDAKVPEGLEAGNRVVVLLENDELKAIHGGHFPFFPGGFHGPFPGDILPGGLVPGDHFPRICEGEGGPFREMLPCKPKPVEPEAETAPEA